MSQSLLQARENLEWMCRSAWNISARQLPGSGLILPRGYDKRVPDIESGGTRCYADGPARECWLTRRAEFNPDCVQSGLGGPLR